MCLALVILTVVVTSLLSLSTTTPVYCRVTTGGLKYIWRKMVNHLEGLMWWRGLEMIWCSQTEWTEWRWCWCFYEWTMTRGSLSVMDDRLVSMWDTDSTLHVHMLIWPTGWTSCLYELWMWLFWTDFSGYCSCCNVNELWRETVKDKNVAAYSWIWELCCWIHYTCMYRITVI